MRKAPPSDSSAGPAGVPSRHTPNRTAVEGRRRRTAAQVDRRNGVWRPTAGSLPGWPPPTAGRQVPGWRPPRSGGRPPRIPRRPAGECRPLADDAVVAAGRRHRVGVGEAEQQREVGSNAARNSSSSARTTSLGRSPAARATAPGPPAGIAPPAARCRLGADSVVRAHHRAKTVEQRDQAVPDWNARCAGGEKAVGQPGGQSAHQRVR